MPRLAANDIPHTSQTDHRVARRPVVETEIATGPSGEWEFFDDEDQRLAPWEVDRARGMAWAKRISESALASKAWSQQAKALLISSLRAAPDDVPVLRGLGYLAVNEGNPAEAREYLERALAVAPRDAKSLKLLVSACYRLGNLEAGIEASERLLKVDPSCALDHAALAQALFQIGESKRALQAAEQALAVDPTLSEPRTWLIQAYRQAGDRRASQKHAAILRRIREVH
jgi:tetratricopeptide (TPR) repeat protein